jgi:hypothetical protein
MELAGLGNLTRDLLNQLFGQDQNPQFGTTHVRAEPATGGDGLPEDRFTPSTQNNSAQTAAQEAGLFQVTQFAAFSLAAEFLQTQAATPPKILTATPTQANATNTVQQPSAAPPTVLTAAFAEVVETSFTETVQLPPPAAPAAPTIVPAPSVLATATTPAKQPAAAAPALLTAAPAPAVQSATTIPVQKPPAAPIAAAANTATTGNALDQLQALNNALVALGLNNNDVQTIDRIASLINDFNPIAFTSLVHQLQALAQLVAPPATAAQTAAPVTGATTGNNSANGNGGGFQIQELVIKFNGVEGTVNSGTTNAAGASQQSTGGTTTQFSAFNLQVEEIRLTLTNNSGQTVQVQAPQRQDVDTDHGDRQTNQVKTAAA